MGSGSLSYTTKDGRNGTSSHSSSRYHDNALLPIAEFQWWFDVIRDNDVTAVERVLNAASARDVDRMINGTFDYHNEELYRILRLSKAAQCQVVRPLGVALLSGSIDVARCLLERGSDPLRRKPSGDTLLHVLVTYMSLAAQNEDMVAPFYEGFVALLSADKRRQLLHTENLDGLRPLELAASLGCTRLVRIILQTPDAYVTREEVCGIMRCQWIDVTEYELSRRDKSPLGFLVLMKEETLRKPGTRELFRWLPIRQWCRATKRPSLVLLAAWLFIRIIPYVIFSLVASDERVFTSMGGVSDARMAENPALNHTFVYCSGIVHNFFIAAASLAMPIYLAIHGASIVLFDVLEMIWINARRSPRYLCRDRYLCVDSVVSCVFYRVSQCGLGVIQTYIACALIFQLHLGDTATQAVTLLCFMAYAVSVLYFVQLLPILGGYVIAIQRMLCDLVSFGVIYCVWLLPFAQYFIIGMNTSSPDGCVEEFSTMGRSTYSTFLIMLNMLNLTQFHVSTPDIIVIVHIAFVFIIAILLINFLVAVMATSSAAIAEDKHLIVTLEEVTVALVLQHRLGLVLPRYFRWCKAAVMHVEQHKYYLLNMETHCRAAQVLNTKEALGEREAGVGVDENPA